jgi:hypothetical protein
MTKKKLTLDITEPQLNALFDLLSDTEAMIGMSDRDKDTQRQLRLIYRMLKANGYEIIQ